MIPLIRKNNKNTRQIFLDTDGKLPLFKFRIFEEIGMVKHAFTTRMGGVSGGIFSTLNLSFSRGDKREDVKENYRRLADGLDVEYASFVSSDQTHTTNVVRVGREDRGSGILYERKFHDTDGMVTDDPEVTLITYHADCAPLYFVDPAHRAIGLSHSGWRGTAGRMGQATLEKMRREFGTDPKDVYCAIGPSICADCYEVGKEVAEAFAKEFAGRETEVLKDKRNGKYLLDLWRANEIVLTDAGVLPEHLAVTDVCTCCNSALLFSHRASGGKRGNLAAALALRKP